MAVLDCESHESSLKSICDLYGTDVTRVNKFLLKVDLDEEYLREIVLKDSDDHLTDLFEKHFGKPTQVLDRVCWFHLTKVPLGTDFSEGILPLHLALDKIWRTVISIPSDPRKRAHLQKLRKEGVPNHLYLLKTQNLIHSGPFAMLVRETAFHANSMGNHDYLEFPEIIEHICNGYEQAFGESIHQEISVALRKCIVKFEVTDESGNDLIAPSLLYCWCTAHNEELSYGANTCYDGRGTTIRFAAIRKVEFL